MKARKWRGGMGETMSDDMLQWSRADEGAEISARRALATTSTRLQWSRADEGAEI